MNLQDKSETINALPYDIRAEYLVSSLLAEGVSPKDILVLFSGPLKRKWSTDISHAEVEEFESGKEALGIHLNRSGIYDSLPEALFHTFSGNRNTMGKDMVKESMKLKAEEKQARIFFRPFETEFFLHNASVSLKEDQEFQILYSDFLNGLNPGFWKIDEAIPARYMSKLIRFLPFAHQITGNYDLTAKCLGQILGEKVNIELSHEIVADDAQTAFSNSSRAGSLGESKLGNEFIAGNTVSGFMGKLVIKIGPLEKTQFKDFFTDGPAELLLKSFMSYFFPVELDTETKLIIEKKQELFVLNAEDTSEKSFLGYNTML